MNRLIENDVLKFWQEENEVVVIPENVVEIGPECFRSNKNIKKVIFNSRCTKINSYAFFGCSNLEEVVFPEDSKMRMIQEKAFDSCYKLKDFVYPKGVKIINELGCNPRRVVLPPNVKTIKETASIGCVPLYIPESLEKIKVVDWKSPTFKSVAFTTAKEVKKEWLSIWVVTNSIDTVIRENDDFYYCICEDENAERYVSIVDLKKKEGGIFIVPSTIENLVVRKVYFNIYDIESYSGVPVIYIPKTVESVKQSYGYGKNATFLVEDKDADIAKIFGSHLLKKEDSSYRKGVTLKDIIYKDSCCYIDNGEYFDLVCVTTDVNFIDVPQYINNKEVKYVNNLLVLNTQLSVVKLPENCKFYCNGFNQRNAHQLICYYIGNKFYSFHEKDMEAIKNIQKTANIIGGSIFYLIVERNNQKEIILRTYQNGHRVGFIDGIPITGAYLDCVNSNQTKEVLDYIFYNLTLY